MPLRTHSLAAAALVLAACGGDAAPEKPGIQPGADDQATVQQALIEVKDGGTVELGTGTFHFTGELSIRGVKNLTVKGQGTGTVLDFSGQTSGANGIAAENADGIVFTRFVVEDTTGDGIRVEKSAGVTFRDVKVSWTAGSDTGNGAYALYPVHASDILVEGCEISGARDAGIYVGQSNHALVRNNDVHGNVAGIEIENTQDAEVTGNHVTDNAGGILVFNLPDLEVKDGRRALVHGNEVVANNRDNFAAGGIVSFVPAGVGVVVLAADEIEITDNDVHDNQSAGVAITTYSTIAALGDLHTDDTTYDVYPETIDVHDNRLASNGASPRGVLAAIGGGDLLWDGVSNADRSDPDGALRVCGRNDGASATFLKLGKPVGQGERSTDWSVIDCSHPPVASVKL
jgi:parallel beta-helix repeat protein